MTQHPYEKKWVVYVSTFPPRECGIATFTQDLMDAFDGMYTPREEAKVIAMNPDGLTQYTYDKKKVIFQIPQPDEDAYLKAAQHVNVMSQVALVHVQHEFGIFGGTYGRHLILFLRELKKPTIITFHTVLPSPNPELRETVVSINNHVQRIIVMTELSKRILVEAYGIDGEKISVIPHGIHSVDWSDGKKSRKDLGLSRWTVISTFGLIGRGKGIEYGIEAMAEVVKRHPDTAYLIIGATHPMVLKHEGESYRNSLERKVYELKLEHNVFFYDNYLTVDELLKFLDATDIYLALSQDPNQAASGTLSYALGSGRPVVSTAFAQAREDVKSEVGMLVDFHDVPAIAASLEALVADPERRSQMGKNAYFRTRSRTWSNVMLSHMADYIKLVPAVGEVEKNLPKIRLSHIEELTDDFGMIQFATITTPDPASGYTTDDNARALIALTRFYEKTSKKRALSLIQTYLKFLQFVERKDGKGFHNYVNINRQIPRSQHDTENLESTTARTLYALAKAASSPKLPESMRSRAADLFRNNKSFGDSMTSPRSIAYHIKALSAWSSVEDKPELREVIKRLADVLVGMFEVNSSSHWKWFEEIVAYSNGVMPDALIDAYGILKDEKYLCVARESLDFLIRYSFEGDVCVPIGQNGWLKRGQQKYMHDQQPEEAAVLVFTLKSMYRITGEEKYARLMKSAFSWFLGNNTLRQVVYSEATGGCYDGVGEREINLNQGAESTIMYLLARLSFE